MGSAFKRAALKTPSPSRGKSNGLDRFIPSRRMDQSQGINSLDQRTPVAARSYTKTTTPAKENYRKMLYESLVGDPNLTPRVLNFSSPPKTSTKVTEKASPVPTPKGKHTPKRKIPRAPEFVLDAPDLPNNFYLNLLDWSSRNFVAIGLGEGVYIWNCTNGEVQQLTFDGQGQVTSVSWGEDGRTVAVGFSSGTTEIWNLSPKRKVKVLPGHIGRVGSLSWSNALVATGGKDASIKCHDVRENFHLISKMTVHTDEVCGLKFSRNGNMLASGANDNMVLVWDTRNLLVKPGKLSALHQFKEHTAAVKALAWSPAQANTLASGGGTSDKTIKVWNTMEGKLVSSLDTGSQVVGLAWNQDGSELASAHGFSTNCIQVWKYPSMMQLGSLEGHRGRILAMAQGPDGETLATAGADETLRIWRTFPVKVTEDQRKTPSKLQQSIR